MKKVALFLLFLLLIIPTHLSFADSTNILKLDFKTEAFFHNLEYLEEAAEFKEGQTFFGNHVWFQGVYEANEEVSFSTGVFFGKIYGSEKSLDPIEPLLTFDYHPDDDFRFVFGNLDTKKHKLWEAIFDDVIRYDRPLETGAEIFYAHNAFSERVWINWQKLNTSKHREKFDIGSISKLNLDPLSFEAQAHIIHEGGQLHSEGSLSDNFVIGVGAQYKVRALNESRVSVRWLYSYDRPDRSDESLTKSGRGVEIEFYIPLSDWEIIYSAWFGDDFLTEDGDPFYRADELMKLEINKTFNITKNVEIVMGVTGFWLEDAFTHSEKVLLSYSTDFNMFN